MEKIYIYIMPCIGYMMQGMKQWKIVLKNYIYKTKESIHFITQENSFSFVPAVSKSKQNKYFFNKRLNAIPYVTKMKWGC